MSVSNVDKKSVLTPDVYGINSYVEEIKKRFHPDVNEDTLMLGIFGYTGQIFSDMLQNTIVMASEFSNESIPTKAKFEKNIISHALGLNITDINATPAQFDVLLTFIEDDITNWANAKTADGRELPWTFKFDKNTEIYIGNYCFHTDYDIEIKKVKLKNTGSTDDFAYTARYLINDANNPDNPVSDITNPYLPSPVKMRVNGMNIIFTKCTIRQVNKTTIYKKILSDNSITSKTLTFDFEGQLAAFDIDVAEGDTVTHCVPIYEGLSVGNLKYPYFYYSYLDSNTIRIKFDRYSYAPRINSEVRINIQTTEGEGGNFTFDKNIYPSFSCSSTRFEYSNIGVEIRPVTGESLYGTDKKSIDELKRLIPKEALSRGSITNTTDLENFFNMINTDESKLYIYKKRDNALERLYYSFILMRDMYNEIIPTNTIDIHVSPDMLESEEGSNKLIFKKNQQIALVENNYNIIEGEFNYPESMPTNSKIGDFVKIGTAWYEYNGVEWVVSKINPYETKYHGELVSADDETQYLDEFRYIIPYNLIINKSPLYGMYFLSIIDTKKFLDFTYINPSSLYQYIATSINIYRPYLDVTDTEEDESSRYELSISMEQNVNNKSGNPMIELDEDGNIVNCNIRCVAVFYNEEDEPYRWAEGSITNYQDGANIFQYKFNLVTEDYIDIYNRIRINKTGLYDKGTNNESYGHFNSTTKCVIHILYKYIDDSGNIIIYNDTNTKNKDDLASIVPDLDDYTLSNSYTVNEGVNFFYDYSDIINSVVVAENQDSDNKYFRIKDVPVVKYGYFDSEDKATYFCNELVRRKTYIDYAIQVLEDAFGMNFKFFNTYGPSQLFTLDNELNCINRVNLSLTFRLRLNPNYDTNIVNNIISDIKDYMEDINDIHSLHMSNLVTEITNKYSESIVFFEFVDMNGYGPGYQHVYAMDMPDKVTTPEFLNINNIYLEDEGTSKPDITIIMA